MKRSIKLHIDELVLHGFERMDRCRLAEVVGSELSRLFMEQGVPSSLGLGGECPMIDGGEWNVAANSGAEMSGAQIAKAVYGGLESASIVNVNDITSGFCMRGINDFIS